MADVNRIRMPSTQQADFTQSNLLRAMAQEQLQKGLGSLTTAVQDAGKVIQGQNMSQLQDYVNQAQTVEQYNDPTYQQGVRDLVSSFRGELDQSAYQKLMQTTPDNLLNRENAQIALGTNRLNAEQNQLKIADESVWANLTDALAGDRLSEAQQYAKQLKAVGSSQQALALLQNYQQHDSTLRTQEQARTLAAGNFGLAQNADKRADEQWENTKEQQRYALEALGLTGNSGWNGEGGGGNGNSGGQGSYIPNTPLSNGGFKGARSGSTFKDIRLNSNVDGLIREVTSDSAEQALLRSIFTIESGGDPRAKNDTTSAYGLGQMTNGAWKDYGAGDRHNPRDQAVGSLRYLRALGKKYGNDPAMAAYAYHSGPGTMDDVKAAWEKGGKKKHWVSYINPKDTAGIQYLHKFADVMGEYGKTNSPTMGYPESPSVTLGNVKIPLPNYTVPQPTRQPSGNQLPSPSRQPTAKGSNALATQAERLQANTPALNMTEGEVKRAEQDSANREKSGFTKNIGVAPSLAAWRRQMSKLKDTEGFDRISYGNLNDIESIVGTVAKDLPDVSQAALAEAVYQDVLAGHSWTPFVGSINEDVIRKSANQFLMNYRNEEKTRMDLENQRVLLGQQKSQESARQKYAEAQAKAQQNQISYLQRLAFGR